MDFQSSIVACLLCCHGCAIYWWGEIARNHDRDSLYSRVTYFCLNSWYLYIYWWLPSGRINGYDSRYGNDFGDNRAISRVVYHLGGVESAVNKLTEIDPSLVSPYGPNEMLDFQFMASFWILVCFGVVGLPHTAVRCMAFKDSKALHRGMLIGTIVLSVIMFGMHLAGALGRAVVPDLTVSDKVIPTLMLEVLPPIVAGIFLASADVSDYVYG